MQESHWTNSVFEDLRCSGVIAVSLQSPSSGHIACLSVAESTCVGQAGPEILERWNTHGAPGQDDL